MKEAVFEITENRPLTENVFRMVLSGKEAETLRPGQFVNIRLDGLYLRRPISVCDAEGDRLTLIYKVVGKGTDLMSKMTGGRLSLLVGLGNGYDHEKSGGSPLLIGGGVGVPPLYMLAKELKRSGKDVGVVLGFSTKSEVFYEDEFRALGCSVTVATADGSYGKKGFVTDALPEKYSYVYTCGPEPMLRAVYAKITTSGQFSFEERMGCGFGACMGCSCKTVTGYKRICRDGPVLEKEEILWQTQG